MRPPCVMISASISKDLPAHQRGTGHWIPARRSKLSLFSHGHASQGSRQSQRSHDKKSQKPLHNFACSLRAAMLPRHVLLPPCSAPGVLSALSPTYSANGGPWSHHIPIVLLAASLRRAELLKPFFSSVQRKTASSSDLRS